MVGILRQISNHLHSTSDPAPNSIVVGATFPQATIRFLTTSLVLVLLDGTLALVLKHWQRSYMQNLKTFHNPKDQAKN